MHIRWETAAISICSCRALGMVPLAARHHARTGSWPQHKHLPRLFGRLSSLERSGCVCRGGHWSRTGCCCLRPPKRPPSAFSVLLRSAGTDVRPVGRNTCSLYVPSATDRCGADACACDAICGHWLRLGGWRHADAGQQWLAPPRHRAARHGCRHGYVDRCLHGYLDAHLCRWTASGVRPAFHSPRPPARHPSPGAGVRCVHPAWSRRIHSRHSRCAVGC